MQIDNVSFQVDDDLFSDLPTTHSRPLQVIPIPLAPLDPPPEVGIAPALRERIVRTLLLGHTGSGDPRLEAGLLGLDVDRDYIAFRARPRPGHQIARLRDELGVDRSPGRGGLAVVHGEFLIGILPCAPQAVTTGVVGIGPGAQPERLVETFRLASRAMHAATAFDLVGVHSFEDMGLLITIATDTDTGDALRTRYICPIREERWASEILSAIRTWFDCDMHVDRAAARMSMHPNTLRNRIAKFEELADADLREPMIAMQVWWALQYEELGTPALLSTGRSA
jgi:hypothetical protein